MTEQPIKRNRYFDPPNFECDVNGRNVDEDIQNFHLFSSQAQLASLHNWGIAQGLEVNGIAGSSTLTINPGVAVDAQGRLIVLATQGRGDIGSNPPGGNHNPLAVPVALDTSGLDQDSYYLTIEFSEILRFDDGGAGCGRLEQAPWLRLQPVSGFTDDGSSVVLAVVTLDSDGNIVSLTHQDISTPLARHLVGKTVGQLEIRRSQTAGNAISETSAGKLEAIATGGLQLSVTSASDQIIFNEVNGNNFSSLSVEANTFSTSGNVGIGTTTPTAKLEVIGNLRLEAGATVNEFSSDGTFSSNSELAVPTERAVKTYVDGEIATVNTTLNTALSTKAALNGSATEDFQTRNLTVNGNLTTTGSLDVGGDLRLRGSDIRDAGNTARITLTDNGRLDLKEDNGGIAISVATNGNVGIGTATPTAKLEVAGEIKASGIIRATNGFRTSTNDWEIARNGESLEIREPEQNNKVWARFNDDNSLHLIGTPNLVVDGNVQAKGTVFTDGNVQAKGSIFTDGQVIAKGTVFTDGNVQAKGTVFTDGNVQAKGTVFTDGNVQAKGSIFTDGQVVAQREIFGRSKHFVMDHPLDQTKNIIYTAIEGPEVAAYLRGQSKLVNGQAEIEFPEHFSLIVNSATITIQLTPHSADSKGLAVVSQSELGFCVRELWQGEGNYKFYYFVAGVRQGMEDFAPVVDKGFTALGEPMGIAAAEITVTPQEASNPD